MSDRFLTVWMVYNNPSDHPGKWVLRAHDCYPGETVARKECAVADSLEAVRQALPPGLVKLTRSPGDDPVIYESWI